VKRTRATVTEAVVLLAGLGLGTVGAAAHPAQPSAAATREPDRTLIDRYCVACHSDRLKTAGLTLEKLDLADARANGPVLEKVVTKIQSGQMPPMGRPRPDRATARVFTTALEDQLDRAHVPNPGRVVAHRLNRVEYVNAIRDLLALEIDPAVLPVDAAGVNFDNNAEGLTVTPALMNRYMSAAGKISRLALGDPGQKTASTVYRASDFARQTARLGDDLPFGTHGGLAVRHAFPLDGQYAFKVRLQRNTIGDTIRGIDDEHEVQVRVDHVLVERFRIGGQHKGFDPGLVNGAPDDDLEGKQLHTYRLTADDALQVRLPVKAGTRLVTVSFSDSAPAVSENVPLAPSSAKRSFFTDDAGDPGIERITIEGPYQALVPEDTPSRRQIFICRPGPRQAAEPCARRILRTLAHRAYRRPVTDEDLAELLQLYRTGYRQGGPQSSFEAGIGLALEALLWSPAFLIRMERDPIGVVPGSSHRVSDIELASRVSFFLWKSIPDEELLKVAEARRLHEPDVLRAQVRRMIDDPKGRRWMIDFVNQWLTIRNVRSQEPDPDLFPEFDGSVRDAMARETELVFESQVREDRSVLDLLRAEYTFLNARLAEHYRIPGVYGSHFRRVAVTDSRRIGLLGHASVQTASSYAHRTSVVLRGKWILETLVGAPPPPPPANVPPLKENERGAPATSLRARMEQHRQNAVCANCHAAMDPLGFALENFDATGRWRETDSGAAIDTKSTMVDGSSFEGPAGIREYLLTRSDQYGRTVIRKLLEYAIGRGLEHYDAPVVRQIERRMAADGQRWSSLVMAIVESDPFQLRRAGES
jgi:cytochrome c5